MKKFLLLLLMIGGCAKQRVDEHNMPDPVMPVQASMIPTKPAENITSPVLASHSKKSYSSGKTVHVRGYRKKNGTYVHSYNRRPPRRKK